MLRFLVHYGIHFIVPVLIAYLFYRPNFKIVVIILLSGILIDIDHLAASPMFSANRCSIDFHLLHSYPAIFVYLILFAIPRTRLIGMALLIHIIADSVDCWLISQS
ncbi:DUF6122 family protein [Flavobacteriaceae bacterium M23B6Z8]